MADIVNKGYWGNMSLGTRFLCNRNIGRQSNRALVMKWSSILQKSFRNDNVKENVTLKYVFAQLQMFRAFSILLASYNEIFRVVFSRPVQTLATTRNIGGPNNVVSCCAILADVCKRSQHVGSLDEKTKDSGTSSISDAIFISCSHLFVWIRGM